MHATSPLSRPNGVHFIATPRTKIFMKKWNPQQGDIVTFHHHGFLLETKKPKFPTLARLRPDLAWEDVVNNFGNPTPPRFPSIRKFSTIQHKPHGHWLD